MPVSYSTPPADPEIDSTSPFYQTLAGLVMFNRGDAKPRGIVHNALGHATASYGGTAAGHESIIIPDSFPFNAPADGAFTNDYSLYVSGQMRCRQWLYEGNKPQSGVAGCTIFGVFNFLPGSYVTGGTSCYPLLGLNTSNYANNGVGQSGIPDAICVVPISNGLCLGYMNTFCIVWSPSHVVIPGHWYAVAATRSDQVGTGINGSFAIANFLRFYLWDLTTNTQIGLNGVGVSQVFSSNFGSRTDHTLSNCALGQYNTTQGGVLIGGEIAIPLTSGPATTLGDGAGSYLIKMVGADSQPWDDSGFAYAIPAGFSGVDQFTYFVNNIYGMVGSTYATDSQTGNLFQAADYQQNSATYLYQGYAGATSAYAAIAGAYSNTNFVFSGDAVLTDVNDTGIQITCSRPQASPSAPSSLTYSLYKFTTYQTSPSGSPVATSTTGVFNYTPPDTGTYFYLVTATDGTNNYVYNIVTASMNLLPDQSWTFIGNSILSHTGGLPSQYAHYANAFRQRIQVLDLGISSMQGQDAVPTYVPFHTGVTFGGTATNGDTVNFIVNNAGLSGGTVTLPISITTSESTTSMATALAAAINANGGLTAQNITATSSGAVVTITNTSTHPTSYNYNITGAATETVLLGTAIGVPAWNLAANNYYDNFSSVIVSDVSYRGSPYTVIGQLATNDLTDSQGSYQGYLTAIQNALLALTTTYQGPTTGSLTNGQTVSVVNRVIWACGPWARGVHPLSQMATNPTYFQYQQNVANGTTVLALGRKALNYGMNYPDDVSGSHPDILAAQAQTMALIQDLFLTPSGGGAFASS